MTLYDLGRQLLKGNEDVRRGNRVHFLANDTSPAILARCAILLAGLHELSQFSAEEIAKRERREVNVLLALLHFGLLSQVVPSYVDERWVRLSNDSLTTQHSTQRSSLQMELGRA